jgi:DEAD/DEAH box helicase domain-containing protein
VLALYPARALIQDQIGKWEAILRPLGIQLGYIDGGVPIEDRAQVLRDSRVVLMTPDVAHAWLMSRLREPAVAALVNQLRLLVLDEAHVYDGVFGTNMAFFLRRLEVVSRPHQLICSTATLGSPADFIRQLTGREVLSLEGDADGSPSPRKTILHATGTAGDAFAGMARLLVAVGQVVGGRFLAFGDSRKMVERIVAAVRRSSVEQGNGQDGDDSSSPSVKSEPRILPYRAGYETEDRNNIQQALCRGSLDGVVSTSAMELGLDIGEIDVVVLLDLPPSLKAFRQRLGRAGRKSPGVCLLIDNRGALAESSGGLDEYLRRPLEPSFLYLENRYIQYAHALCASYELSEQAQQSSNAAPFESLPEDFRRFLSNELSPTELVPTDLYPLKQRAQAGPHREFPIRSGVERDFRVSTPQGERLGNLTFAQALREAYPGAIYYYMARAYRIYSLDYRKGEIHAKRERQWTTRPLAQTTAFPRFFGGIRTLYQAGNAFLAEVEMQVSERVIGFSERRGSTKSQHYYGRASVYCQRAQARFFETTGVCWSFPNDGPTSEKVTLRILEAFCAVCGIQSRDLGMGLFHANASPLGGEKCQGTCIYDAVQGSLRLTQQLAERFSAVLAQAIALSQRGDSADDLSALQDLAQAAKRLAPVRVGCEPTASNGSEDQGDWVEAIASGENAVYLSADGPLEVRVLNYRYTPQGLMYELVPPKGCTGKWMVVSSAVRPIHGETLILRVNLVTGEVLSNHGEQPGVLIASPPLPARQGVTVYEPAQPGASCRL